MSRIFEDTLDFEHVLDLRKNAFPDNVHQYEWMLPPGGFFMHETAQRLHVASSFSEAPRDIIRKDINPLCHLGAAVEIDGKRVISGAGNSDVITPLIDWMLKEKPNSERIVMAEVNSKAPFIWGDMIYEPEMYDYIFEGESFNMTPFCPPKEAINEADHMMGFYSSLLVKDGGTIQVGIGSLGDAITNGILMRHKHNDVYKKLMKNSGIMDIKGELINFWGGYGLFEEGLFVDSEMFVDSFLDLYEEGVLKRKVYDDYHIQKLINEKRITADIDLSTVRELRDAGAIGTPLRENEFEYLVKHGIIRNEALYSKEFLTIGNDKVSTDLDTALSDDSFKKFLGTKLKGGEVIHATLTIAPKEMYERLGKMSLEERKVFSLRNIKFVNTLSGQEDLKREQRKDGRFMNFTLVATLTGAVASETIKNQQVISGIGGQLDFIIMANTLDDARSILILSASRGAGKEVQSNIVFEYSGCSASRQMRDIIITEYGIVDLQGCNDEQCAIEMIKIADSRFRKELLEEAKKYNKIRKDYVLPEEFQLGNALKNFLIDMRDSKLKTITGILHNLFAKTPEVFEKHVERMDLLNPKNFNERFQRAVVITAMKKSR